jgi:DDE superfamily endonuclease
MTSRGRVDRAVFPPEEVAAVKAVACELPASEGVPLSRFSRTELHRLVIERGVTEASASTIWRWLADDALKPWQQRSWVFPRDPEFERKAARVLDLYEGRFEGRLLHPGEFVISADEKTQLQALGRRHPTLAPAPGRPILVEHEYRRGGTLAYLAALDIGRRGKSSRRPRIFGRCEPKSGRKAFGRLVEQVMTTEPYASAKRVFWVVDNGSSHAGQASIDRLEGRWKNLVLVHLPIHASWLNQIEIYFSILQRKALTPNDLGTLAELEQRIMGFQARWQTVARPFEWDFTRRDLRALMARLSDREPQLRLVA